MIINIRGTSGSGKTTVVRELLAMGPVERMHAAGAADLLGAKPGRPEAYRVVIPGVSQPLFALGSYENTCGGCDSIPTQDDICDLVRKYARLGHVVMEGLLLSDLFGRYANLSKEIGVPYIWAFLDTPLDVCLQRVQERRDSRGVARGQLNPGNTSRRWDSMRRVFRKCEAAHLDARWVDHTKATEEVLSWLRA